MGHEDDPEHSSPARPGPAPPPADEAGETGALSRTPAASPNAQQQASDTISSGPVARSGSAPSAGATFAPGDVLAARYRIVRFIAHGGMGEVYEAEDAELGGRVALKTVRPELAALPGTMERFKREIQLARQVTHPNVCRIFDLGLHQTSGRAITFLTMELLGGETLSQRLKRVGRMKPEEALPLVRQMADALATAHEAAIVHRDFKSANVMLVPSKAGERAVVTDFGLARGTVEGGGLGAELTGTGDVMGTPAYMAPEQLEGRKVDHAADIYALGVVLYEMLTGSLPFSGDSPFTAALKKLKEKPPSPRKLIPDLDPRWEGVILRCLERRLEDRFETASDVVRALVGEEVAAGRRGRRRLLVGATVLAALSLVAGYYLARGTRPSTEETAEKAARPSVAVLGLKNTGKPDADWLATALAEMLRTELGAGEQLRTIPGENVARMKLELKLPEAADSLARDTLAGVRANLGADLVVLGSYLALGGSGGKIRLDLRLQDTRKGEVVALASATGSEEELFEIATQAGAELRRSLGIAAISQEQAADVRAALPSGSKAARLYAEGLARLRVFDALEARRLLEEAAAADPDHPMIRSALARAWSALGYDEKAKAEARRAFEAAGKLSREDRLTIEGFSHETTGAWDKAAELYKGLVVFFPDNLDYGLRLAAAQTSAGKGREALATLEALRRLPPPASQDPRIDLAEAEAAKSLTDFKRQRAAAAAAAEKAAKVGARLLLAQARLAEGNGLVDLGQLEEGRKACEEAKAIFAEAGDRRGVAHSEKVIGISFAMGGDLQSARARFEQALEASRSIGDQKGIVQQLENLGNIHMELGEHARAKMLYREALDLSRAIADRSSTARTLNNLGTLLEDTGDLAGASAAYGEALAAFEALGARRNVALALSNIGDVLVKKRQLGAAEERYRQSLELSRQLDQKADTAGTLTRLGRLMVGRGKLEDAAAFLEEALRLHKELDDASGRAAVLRAQGELAARRGDKDAARRLRDEAKALEPGQ